MLLRAHAAELCSPTALRSPRDLDRIKGRLLHYSTAIRHLRIRVTEMQRCMGPLEADDSDTASRPSPFARTASAHYDRPALAPAGLPALAAEMDDLLARYGSLGVPLWPHVTSSAYAALLSGEEKSLFCALTWDASPVGWAALGRWWVRSGPDWELRELLLVGTWAEGWDTSEQPFREALGGALAFEGFAHPWTFKASPASFGTMQRRRSPASAREARSLLKCSDARYGSTGRTRRSMWTCYHTMLRAIPW